MAVVQFSNYASAQSANSTSPFAGILAECRDLLLGRLCKSIVGALDQIEDDLVDQRAQADSVETVKLLMEAQDQLRRLRADLERRLRAAFQRNFQQSTGGKGGKDVYASDALSLELSLVDEDQVADEVTVQSLAERLATVCPGELNDLRARVAYMLGQPQLDDDRDPFGPKVIAQVLKDAFWQIDGGKPVKLLLLEQFARSMIGEMPTLYREVNDHLMARKVMPHVPGFAKRGGRKPGNAGESQGGAGAGNLPVGDLAGAIRQLFVPRDQAAGGSSRAQGAASPAQQEFLGLLTRLQRGESGSAVGLADLGITPEAAGASNVLHALADSGLASHAGSFDAILIDVVATLFDYIFNDSRVPESMKGLIGRLQIPVLKLGLLDKAFFSNRTHPARRLINTLAQAASDWEGPFTTETALYRKAESLVLRIQNEFADDPQMFVGCLNELETFLSEEEARADAKAATLTRQLEQRERTEIARLVAQEAISHYIEDVSLPVAIRTFLDGSWKRVMVQAAVTGGEDGAMWRCAAKTMDDLVWSVLPKHGAEERRRLVQVLPTLLRGLRDGLDEAGVGTEVRDEFFAELVKLHAAAVKSGMAPDAARQAAKPKPSAAPAAKPPEPAESPAAPAGHGHAEVEALSRGTWIDLREADGTVHRLRLSWLSPARTMYLFTNRQGQRAMALTQAELSRRFANGEAVIADDRPLIDRIVADVLDSLHGGN
jgi:hypothetical protein